MRFFTSFYYVQNDNKSGREEHLGGEFLWQSRKNSPPKCENIHELVIPMQSEESQKINCTVL